MLKTYILLVSKNFLKGHPREGQPTYFKEKILEGEKIHTCRANEDYWATICEQVNQGKAILSLRQWTGRPYASKQEEFMQLNSCGFQPFDIDECGVMAIDRFYVDPDFDEEQLAKNDGLSYNDFIHWFNLHKSPVPKFEGGIIHFTNFRYQ